MTGVALDAFLSPAFAVALDAFLVATFLAGANPGAVGQSLADLSKVAIKCRTGLCESLDFQSTLAIVLFTSPKSH